jgi:DNA-binding NarL/FixJ family response regulator
MERNLKVLVVDESLIVRERLMEMISELEDIEIVGQEENLIQAQESIHKFKPDAIIVDPCWPGENCMELLREIKKTYSNCKVIIFTSHTLPKYKEKCLATGADFFFDKPTEFQLIPKVLLQWAQELFKGKDTLVDTTPSEQNRDPQVPDKPNLDSRNSMNITGRHKRGG